MQQKMSVVVPAHNEANVIARLLGALTNDPRANELEIVVIPNGCTDATAVLASAFPGVTVSSIEVGSKIAALAEGDRLASTFPRAYVDADVLVSANTLLALADALTQPDGPLVAAPTLVVDTTGASWPVRQFYRIWELTDYRQRDHVGSGIYALSAAGRARFEHWPQVIADDRFVQQLFQTSERLTLASHSFAVQSPRTLRFHIRRSTRIVRGNLELPSSLQIAPRPSWARHGALALRVLRRPSLWLAFTIYVFSSAVAALLARSERRRGEMAEWHRDESTRNTSGH